MEPLSGMKVVTLAVNLPGPVAARQLLRLGARVLKVEPPAGDPMALYRDRWYHQLNAGQEILILDLKEPAERERLFEELATTDLLLSASRPEALQRLGLDWDSLHRRFDRLCMVQIVGYPPPRENQPGHDLTYQAAHGLLSPPQMPRTLVADMAGGERAAAVALGLLLARERGLGSGCAQVPLSAVVESMAEPLQHGLTGGGELLGGGLAEYNVYPAREGWVAVAALEPHFRRRLVLELGVDFTKPEDLRPCFVEKSAAEWESWAQERDLPIVEVK